MSTAKRDTETESTRDQAQWPFDKATRLKHATETTRASSPLPSLPDRLRHQFHDLPFLSPLNVVILAVTLLSSLHLIGLYLFCNGFLLTRQALTEINDCDPITANGHRDPSCSLPATHQKLVLLVIDALRSDFVLPVDPSHLSSNPESTFWSNHLTLPTQLTEQDPTRSFLFHFIADAPTTTLQRLKGLTTGSLPTFIDAGSNFGGEKIEEDNWLAQAKRNGKKLTMIGDDTWLKVFPRPDPLNRGNLSTSSPGACVWREEGEVWPFDSFNVEDLDTVDRGVVHHLLPLLDGQRGDWDIVIAHTLGLDHSGHRYGPAHSETTRKLKEAQTLLAQVVERLDDDTLLIVMGDHGMTDSGDHGGDSREELDAALWIYSKGPQLAHHSWFEHDPFSGKHPVASLLASSIDNSDFADSTYLDWTAKGLSGLVRSVAQVDLVSTISLLLGLPIPFGNLGVPIPDVLFHSASLPIAPSPSAPPQSKGDTHKRSIFNLGRSKDSAQKQSHETLSPLSTLLQANMISSSQLSHYVQTYTSHASGKDLARFLPELHFQLALAKSAFRGAYGPDRDQKELEVQALKHLWAYQRTARHRTRQIWARFDMVLIASGLIVLLLGVAVGAALYFAARNIRDLRAVVGSGLEGAAAVTWLTVALRLMGAMSWMGNHQNYGSLVLLAMGAGVPIVSRAVSIELGHHSWWGVLALAPVLSHSASFASNSFTVHEDSIVRYLLSTLLILGLARSFSAPDTRLRQRLLAFNAIALVGTQAISYSTVCREEQAPFCRATFFLTPGTSTALFVLGLASCLMLSLPLVLRRSLAQSKSDVGLAPSFLGILLRSVIAFVCAYWVVEGSIASMTVSVDKLAFLVRLKTGFARTAQAFSILSASLLWYHTPLCIRVQTEPAKVDGPKQVKLIGYGNALGSSYLLLCASCFTLLLLVNPPVGQVVLVLQIVVLLALLEIFDAERDVAHLTSAVFDEASLEALLNETLPTSAPNKGPTFFQLSAVSLLSHLAFFSTGHQATFASIQWSTAFIGFPIVTYPFSPALVVLNTLGPHLLTALFVPLFALWNVSPTLKDQSPHLLPRFLMKTVIGYLVYESIVALSSAAFAAFFKRHLFVWKVFAPRFMLSGITVAGIEGVLILIGLIWGVRGVLTKARNSLGTQVAL